MCLLYVPPVIFSAQFLVVTGPLRHSGTLPGITPVFDSNRDHFSGFSSRVWVWLRSIAMRPITRSRAIAAVRHPDVGAVKGHGVGTAAWHRQSRGRRAILKEKPHFRWLSSSGAGQCRSNGQTCRTILTTPPPFTRRLAGSSVTEASRGVHEPVPAACPRAPRNAPVPPVTIRLERTNDGGAPGGGAPLKSPWMKMVPTATPPSVKISNEQSSIMAREVSAIAFILPTVAVGLRNVRGGTLPCETDGRLRRRRSGCRWSDVVAISGFAGTKSSGAAYHYRSSSV